MSESSDPDDPVTCEALRERIRGLKLELAESRGASGFLASVLQAVPAYISNLDPDLNIRFFSHYQPGHTPESTVGRSVFDFMAAEDRELARARIDEARATGKIVSYTLQRAAGPHGEPTSYLTRVAPVRELDGRLGACLVAVDTTEEHQRERQLRETQESLKLAVRATGFGLWSLELGAGTVSWDERMQELHGATEPVAPAAYADAFVHPEDRPIVRAAMKQLAATGLAQQETYRVICPDGTTRWLLTVGRALVDDDGNMLKIMGGTLDVTRQREMEEQARKGQRMEAVARLTAGVAHNFNNMLAVILPILELARPLVPPDFQPMLHDGLHAASRAAELVKQLMTYAGRSAAPNRVQCAVQEMVQAAVSLCRHTFDQRIDLRVELPSEPCFVACDAGQIEQVLVNLLLNARDAVSAKQTAAGQVLVTARHSASAVQDIVIAVEDDGVGMPERVCARMFEPFFSTKPVGKGTGLGLATSYAMVRDHGGELRCESTAGVGSRFTVSLPTVSKREPEHRVMPTRAALAGTHVLVVDDDDLVRGMLKALLTGAGLHVVEAASCAQAARRIEAHPETQIVLLDRSMPDGPGERVIGELRRFAPRAPIVFLSGQLIDESAAALADAVLQKPITRAHLLDTIAALLQARDASA